MADKILLMNQSGPVWVAVGLVVILLILGGSILYNNLNKNNQLTTSPLMNTPIPSSTVTPTETPVVSPSAQMSPSPTPNNPTVNINIQTSTSTPAPTPSPTAATNSY